MRRHLKMLIMILLKKLQRMNGFRIRCILWMYLLCGCVGIQGLVNVTFKCPKVCMCSVSDKTGDLHVDCTNKNMSSLPEDLDVKTVILDLSLNQLSSLPDGAFSNLTSLKSLSLVSNSIRSLSANVFKGLHDLVHLSLQGNRLRTVPAVALSDLPSLRILYLDNNLITSVPDDSFKPLKKLSNLNLNANLLTEIPVAAINQAKNLGAIEFDFNQIEEVPNYAFVNLTNLAVVILSNNQLSQIGENAFYGLQVLKLLDMSNNRLTEMPVAVNDLPDLFDLSVTENKIAYLPDGCFSGNKKLAILSLKDNPIASCGMNTFSGLPKLKELVLSEAHELTSFPNLAGSNGLEKVSFDRASISSLPDNLCQNLHSLIVLDVHTNHISSIPNMSDCTALTSLNLGNNGISEIAGSPLEGLKSLKDLILSYNKIKYLSDKAFRGLHKLQYLDLSNNVISYIHPDAFADLKSLEDLNVGENQFASLPTKGLQRLRHLKTFHNTRLQEPLPYDAFPHILTLKVAYAYHCCAFINHDKGDKNVEGAVTFDEKITWLRNPNDTLFYADRGNLSYDWDSEFYLDFEPPLYDMSLNYSNLNGTPGENDIIDDDYYDEHIYTIENMVRIKPPVRCEPLPDPFQPCDDLFGWWSLRCGVWIVFLLAVLGNATVLFVSLTSKSKMDVTRFLICNLAMSDLCMGIYLGFLAVVDASTLGKFENHAIYWQTGPGCLVAGFLGVLSSELSVFTLVVITVERFYAISHAMQIGKRVRLGHAGIVMACGWVVCLSIASLPLFKVSDYRKFAICLPFDTEDELSLAYVCFIMIFNAISFIVIVICYAGMFISIRASHTWNSKDSIVAKRMALLVFTDFFCWAPIIFFSLTAAFNWHLARISLDEAKVLTIFVLPLNSCANPFLYAFFTRQFKRDCVKLCKRIEESSISRHFSSSGLGRMSAVSHRHHQNNSCNGKRSCENSLNEPSTSGEASSSNNPSDDSDLTVRKIPLTREDKQILHYMRSSVRLPPSRLASPTELSSPESEKRLMLNSRRECRAAKLSPRQKLNDEEVDSSHDIVLHTKEGNVYLSAKPKTFKSVRNNEGKIRFHRTDKCAHRLCNHSVKSTKRTQSVPFGSRSVHSQTADSNGDDENIKTLHDMETETLNNFDDKARKKFETNRSKELGLKIDKFKSKPVQVNSIFEPEITPRKTISTQTEMLVQLRHTQKPDLTADITKREKDKHINEWRKTSHLSFLWRNSGNFDVLNQKQKSNSLVELTRPLTNLQNVATKRHSLTSKHEGYILLKNSSRDSAYEEDELYEFYDGNIKCPDVEKQNYQCSDKKTKCDKDRIEMTKEYKDCSKNMDFSMDSDEMCETSLLLTDRLPDNLCIPKGRQSCDIESGISSSS